MKTVIHAGAGAVVLVCLLSCWISTAVAELFLGPAAVVAVKLGVLTGLWVLVPAMAIVGGSGFSLANGRVGGLVDAKRKRMRIVGMNGLLIMLPSAFFLAHKAAAGQFDLLFYVIQGVELTVGMVQLLLIGRNFKDGLALAGRLQRTSA